MNKILSSIRTFVGLVISLGVLTAIGVFLPQGDFSSLPGGQQSLPASKPIVAVLSAGVILLVYGGLGFVGLILSQKLGFADIWDKKVSNRKRFLFPAAYGFGLGFFFILADSVIGRLHAFGPLPHPPFPTSFVASAAAGIGEEIIFRLFFIPFWVWLIAYVILKKRRQDQVFWIIAIISAIVFALAHIPSIMIIFGLETISEIPAALLTEILLLNGIITLFAAYHFRKYGFLAAVGIHFWADVVWHVFWGAVR